MRMFDIKKLFLGKLFIVFLTLTFCLFFLEIGLRSLGKKPSNVTSGFCEQYGDSYRLKKNIKKVINYPAFSYLVYTNSFGFRDKTTGDRNIDEKPYVVFLGASEVFGNGVDYEDTFVGIFAEYASKRGIEVLNLAIGGHYFLDQELLLKDFINSVKRKPQTVLFCLNALHIPKFDRRNNHVFVKNGFLFDKKNWRTAYVRLMMGNISSAYCFFRDNIRKFQERWLGYEFTQKSPEFLQIYSKNNRMYQDSAVEQFENYLSEFEHYCKENRITLIYIYMPIIDSYRLNELLIELNKNPDDYDTSYYEKLMEAYCSRRNVRLINLRPVLKKYYDEGRELRFKLDPHYTAFANRVIGEYLNRKVFFGEELQ